MKYTITALTRKTTKKDGTPLITKDGRPYAMLSIKTQEHGDKWLSGFENSISKNWTVGTTAEFNVVPNGEYLNFEIPKPEDALKAAIEALTRRVEVLEKGSSIVPENLPSDLDLDL
jgi:hypothetical protein